eukprot:10807491-Prorocentrum_lima.AAC.1
MQSMLQAAGAPLDVVSDTAASNATTSRVVPSFNEVVPRDLLFVDSHVQQTPYRDLPQETTQI